MQKSLKVFIGYDSREDIAWQVCRHSLNRHSNIKLDVYPLKQTTVRELGLYVRPQDNGAATEFSLTRFLVPYIAATDDWSVFVDCDFLFTDDIGAMVASLNREKAVYVVQHDYVPRKASKMDGQAQTTYPRKNWSSLMVFNGAHPSVKALLPAAVNSQSPAFLHRLSWAGDETIGSLPLGWNFLEGEYDKPSKLPEAIHFTNGGPWFENCQDVDYGDLWIRERDYYQQATSV